MIKISIWKLYLLAFLIGFIYVPLCFSYKNVNLTEGKKYSDFDARLQFYLDMKMKRFLQKMSVKETFLIQMVDNISIEIKERGKERLIKDGVGFELIYSESNKLLDSYSSEIKTIINIIDELERLEVVIKRSEDLKLLDEVDELKANLTKALDNRKLTRGHLSQRQLASMIDEYSNEVNSLLKLYEDIELFERKAQALGDEEIIKNLHQQKRRIFDALELSRITSPGADKAVEEYITEATNLIVILKELDKLEAVAEDDSMLMSLNLESMRENLINNIDDRILKLFGYTTKTDPQGPTISEYFKEWKAERVAEFQLKLTKYRVVGNQLIKTASQAEKDRMLEREMTDALLNYTGEKYELAILQFNEIYKSYNPYYENLDGLIFYKSESNYANGYFDEAFEGFKKIIEKYPNSQYLGKSYLRMMVICYTYAWYDKFFKYFKNFQLVSNVQPEDLNEANYLSGHIYFKQRKFVDSRKVLENIKEGSKYYKVAQYLLGIVYANLDNYSKAKLVFEQLINMKNYPWTDINTAIIRNDALLKLGYLHYQRGEFDQAISYFEQISKGYEKYDYSLMAQAWAKMKKGDYDATVNNVNLLINNYLLSNYTYEALVLSAHCKKIQKKTDDALKDLRYVTNAKGVLEKTREYNEERKHILTQIDELERLEEQILERQDRNLYPKVVKIRETINNALTSFYFRGTISSQIIKEYNDEKRILIKQINEFKNIMNFAEEQQNNKLYQDAKNHRDRLLLVLETYQNSNTISDVNYVIDYPLAVKEGGTIYRKDIVRKLMNDLISEKRRVKTDLEMITQLLVSSNAETQMEVMMDLEILEEDLRDLGNQLNKFQVWLTSHPISEIQSNTERWADFSGFGISDINFSTYYEQIQKMNTLSKNLSYIDEILSKKKQLLEKRITIFDNEVLKIQKEMEAEKIRLEKLEKEKYFRDIYFDTKTKEIETVSDTEDYFELDNQEP